MEALNEMEKITSPKMWRQYFHSEGEERHNHRSIFLMLKERSGVVASRLVSYLNVNSLMDIWVQHAGIPGFS